jgi:hypothetical protein
VPVRHDASQADLKGISTLWRHPSSRSRNGADACDLERLTILITGRVRHPNSIHVG